MEQGQRKGRGMFAVTCQTAVAGCSGSFGPDHTDGSIANRDSAKDDYKAIKAFGDPDTATESLQRNVGSVRADQQHQRCTPKHFQH